MLFIRGYVCTVCIVPKPQLLLEMRHSLRDGGGQAQQARDLHHAGTEEQQHCCVHGLAAYTLAKILVLYAAETWHQKKEL